MPTPTQPTLWKRQKFVKEEGELNTKPELICGNPLQPLPLAWSPNSQRLLYAHGENDLYILNRKQGKGQSWYYLQWMRQIVDASSLEDLTGCAWSPDGRLLAVSFGNATLVLRVHGSCAQLEIPYAGPYGTAMAWSPDSQRLAVGFLTDDDVLSREAMNVGIWDAHKQALVLTYKGHNESAITGNMRTLSWDADARLLASAGTDSSVHVWDTATGQLRSTYCGHRDRVTTVSFIPTGDIPLIASSGYDGTVQVWNARTSEQIWTHLYDGPSAFSEWYQERRLSWSPDGTCLAFQNTKQELVYLSLPTRQVIALQSLHPYTLQDIAWSPDGTYLATREVDFTRQAEDLMRVCIWPR